jgi:hypothetical protein
MDRIPALGLALATSVVMLVAGIASAGATPPPAPNDIQCNSVQTGVTVRNVTVVPRSTCQLVNSTVTGNVTALAGSYFQADHTTVQGNVQGKGAQTAFLDGGSKVRGSVRGSWVVQVFIFDTTVRGDITIDRASDQVFICGTTVERGSIVVKRSRRNILIGDPLSGGCKGNSVLRGDVTVTGNTTDVELVVRGNRVRRGTMVVSGNQGPSVKIVHGNSGGKRIDCHANSSAFAASKNARWKKATGQCARSVNG